MIYPRTIYAAIKLHLETREIVVITGMRRVGKTTLLQMLFESVESDNKVFLDLENIVNQMVFEEIDFNNIWANLKTYGITPDERSYIFIDELQVKPEVVKAIKYLYDHYDVKFIVTGSSSFYLKNLFPESLAGRKVLFELYPLDFAEFLVFKGISHAPPPDFATKDRQKNVVTYERLKPYYQEYLLYGGFPQVVLTEGDSQKRQHLSDILTSYFEKDVRVLADFRRWSAFRDLLFLLMERVGSKLDITKLSSEVGVTRETVYAYLTFLEATYVVFFLRPFTRNVDREISGARKVYFCDNGFLTQFSHVSPGNLLENAIFLNLRKYGQLHYYQRRTGGEIDFILPRTQTGLEVKQRGTENDWKKLTRIASSIGLEEWYLISRRFSPEAGIIPAMDI